jgi:MoaA/NifB/PqqE/SkfB family radical SAM enzyme
MQDKIEYTIELTKKCPLSCSYCSDHGGHHKNKIQENIFSKHIEFIDYCNSNKQYINVSFVSGECLQIIDEVLQLFPKKFYEYVTFEIRTSLSFKGALKNLTELKKDLLNKGINTTVQMSIHYEYKTEYKKILDSSVLENLVSSINYNFMLYSYDSFKEFKYYKEKYPKKDIIFNIVMPFKNKYTYFDNDFIKNNENIEWLNTLSNEEKDFLFRQDNKWDKWNQNIIEYGKYFHLTEKDTICNLNKNYLDISFDGFILKCANDLYMKPKSNLVITNFTSKDLLGIAKSDNICKWDYCNLFCRFQENNI